MVKQEKLKRVRAEAVVICQCNEKNYSFKDCEKCDNTYCHEVKEQINNFQYAEVLEALNEQYCNSAFEGEFDLWDRRYYLYGEWLDLCERLGRMREIEIEDDKNFNRKKKELKTKIEKLLKYSREKTELDTLEGEERSNFIELMAMRWGIELSTPDEVIMRFIDADGVSNFSDNTKIKELEREGFNVILNKVKIYVLGRKYDLRNKTPNGTGGEALIEKRENDKKQIEEIFKTKFGMTDKEWDNLE
jgi:hypothetical protein